MSNEELVAVIRAGQKSRIGELWTQCEQFIKKMANRWTGTAEFDDLVQQGFLILHDAAADYEPGRDVPFINYLGQRLEWSWARWLEETGAAVRLPSYMVQQIRQYKRVSKEYAAEYGREPSEREIGRLMGVAPSTVRLIHDTALKSRIRSLNEQIQADDGSGTELQDIVADDTDMTADVLDRVQNEQLAGVIWPMVDELEERQARVIWERYKKGRTFKECAGDMGVSLETIRQIEQKAFRELRKPKRAKRLKPFINDMEIYSRGIKRVGAGEFHKTWTSATEREAMRNIERQRDVIPKRNYTQQDVDKMLDELQKKLDALHVDVEQFALLGKG